MTLIRSDIRLVWDSVRPGLIYIKDKCNAAWRPEDVYASCVSGEADVFLVKGYPHRFAIVQVKTCPFSLDKSFLVWIAYDESNDHGAANYLSELEEIAKNYGCDSLEFWSPRKGMQRLTEKSEYKAQSTIYKKRI